MDGREISREEHERRKADVLEQGGVFMDLKGKQLVDEVVKSSPQKAVEIAASYLKNPFSS